MDIQRASVRSRRIRRFAPAAVVTVIVLVLTVTAWAMLNRPPAVSADRLWYGTVERGEMVREVAASGTLVAPRIRAVTNRNAGVVEEVMVLPGDRVEPDDVLIAMSSPELEEDLATARWDLAAAEAEEAVERVDAENRRLDIIAQVAAAESEYTSARLELEAQEELSDAQVYSALEVERSRLRVEQLNRQLEAERARLDRLPELQSAQETATRARLSRQREKVEHLESLIDHLDVRADTPGVIQEINVEDGERLTAGELVARIVDPSHLIARLRVPEREAAAILPGFPVRLELGRESIRGEVVRIDPTARDRHINVDVQLVEEELPSLRPDQSITGRIELERLEDVVHVPRPAAAREENQTLELFVIDDDQRQARRAPVEIGRLSAREAEVRNGLTPGQRIVLADMSEYDEFEVVRIR